MKHYRIWNKYFGNKKNKIILDLLINGYLQKIMKFFLINNYKLNMTILFILENIKDNQ